MVAVWGGVRSLYFDPSTLDGECAGNRIGGLLSRLAADDGRFTVSLTDGTSPHC